MGEARLEDVGSGLVPVTPGWFVVNLRDAAWVERDGFGDRCLFEARGPALRERPDIEPQVFQDFGIAIAVFQPGQPSTLYHAESQQEAFLVLRGECTLLVDGEERTLRAWDFFHCAPGTAHAFVGAGDGPCVLLMTGARRDDGTIVYPDSELARSHGAGVERETDSPAEAYAAYPHWAPARRRAAGLPWEI